jgi:tetratricopeptide (TPR) repeat protein
MEITTSVVRAQDYFDQGIRLYYAFNHAEAIRALREAQRLDPECAMCWWAEALAWGPNINLPMDQPSAEAAFAAIQGALARRSHASPKEQELVDALARRYSADAPDSRAHLDQAYADAMAELVVRHPEDLDIAVLYAESLMDLRPWDYWNEQNIPQPGMEAALAHLQRVIEIDENHPGACHFYIHAVEAVYPERAVPCAERLAGLMPGAGHLVHMPGHIYIRVGRYLDAVNANQHAVHADETFIQDQHPDMGMYTAGYYPHNYDFLAFAAMMIGRSKLAMESAEKVTALLPAELFGSPGMDFLQHWSVRPLQMQIRFAEWQRILAQPEPAEEYLYARGIWHYARGRALVGTGDLSGAVEELRQLRSLIAEPGLINLRMEFNQASHLLAIAEQVLAGWLAAGQGSRALAVTALEKAVKLEDALLYGEPPEWSIPTRQDLGTVLLIDGRAAEAEAVFREDLTKFPENGWSMHGLIQALREQGHANEADNLQQELNRVWAEADVAVGTGI